MVAGETSGDLLGAGLIEAFRKRYPDAEFEGVAGPAMIAAGCHPIADADELAVMGLIEPLRHVPRLLRLRRSLIRRWLSTPPDIFVGIDAPDFNLALETALKQGGIPTVHYVSPTIWAWRPGRVHKIARAVDCVLCILPFEPELYREVGLSAKFVGHPKADELAAAVDVQAARAALGIAGDGPLVALMPGSRGSEVQRLAQLFAEVAGRIAKARPDVSFVVPVALEKLRAPIHRALSEAKVIDRCTLLKGDSIRAMSASDLVIQASGTAVLEAALLGKPAIAVYKLAPLSAFLVRSLKLLKLDYVTLPNNLTPEPMIPEFLQDEAQPGPIAAEALALLVDEERRGSIREAFAKLRDELALGASDRAADALAEVIGDAAIVRADTHLK